MVRQPTVHRMAFVRVIQVRVQNKNGVIFRGQRITSDGEILDTSHALIVRIQSHGIGVTVLPGQWWSVAGKIESRTFINSGGFEITEEQMEVEPGDAALRKPSGIHIVEYLPAIPGAKGSARLQPNDFGRPLVTPCSAFLTMVTRQPWPMLLTHRGPQSLFKDGRKKG